MEKCQNRNKVETKLIREMPKGYGGKVFLTVHAITGKGEGLGSMEYPVQVRSVSFKYRKITLDCRAM